MSEMIEVKTSDLAGAALDWAVAQVDEVKTIMLNTRKSEKKKPFALFGSLALPLASEEGYAPSSCWHCGGPLIDKHRISLHGPGHHSGVWVSSMNGSETIHTTTGATALEAACRRIVYEHLGDIFKLPVELAQPLNPA